MIEVERLWKSYGRFPALRGIGFAVARGEIAGFLGPNGAGKSTAMRILTTFLSAGSGDARVAGFSVTRQPAEVCARVGYLPEQAALYPELRVEEYLRYRATLKGIRRAEREARIRHLLEECALGEVRRQLAGALSKGYRQRVGLADALLADPEVLILDEPTSGLDPLQAIEVRKLIAGMRGRRTVLLSSHVLGEVEQVCDRVIIIHRGAIVLEQSRAAWQRRLEETGGLRVTFREVAPEIPARLAALPGVESLVRDGNSFALRTRGDLRHALFQLAAAERWQLVELRSREATLEDLFLEVTAGDGGAGA